MSYNTQVKFSYDAGGFLDTFDPMEGSSSKQVLSECVSNSS